MKLIIACLFLFILCPAGIADAPATILPEYVFKQSDVLKGLPQLKVVVEAINTDAEADGLALADVKSLVLLRLNNAKIPVLADTDLPTSASGPILDIVISTLKNPTLNIYCYSVSVSLFETSQLYRNPLIRASAVTWTEGSFGSVGVAGVSGLSQTVGSDVDQFIQDYKSANPLVAVPVSPSQTPKPAVYLELNPPHIALSFSPRIVWVNLYTKIYHLAGSKWYGRTKHGKFMRENLAVKSGYRFSLGD